MSRLAEPGAPHALAARLVLAALGLSLIVVAWALTRRLTTAGPARQLPLAIAGAGIVGVALVSRDVAHPAVLAVHRSIALVVICALAVAPPLAARSLRRDGSLSPYATPSLAAGVLSVVLIGVAVIGLFAGGLPSGAWERTFFGLSLVWVVLLSVRLLRAGPRPGVTAR